MHPSSTRRSPSTSGGRPRPSGASRTRSRRAFSPPLFPIDLGVVPAQVAFDAPRQPGRWKAPVTAALVVGIPGPTLAIASRPTDRASPTCPTEPALTGIEERPSDWISGAAIAEGADVLLHDAQYFEDEYAERIGWATRASPTRSCAKALRVGRLVLFTSRTTPTTFCRGSRSARRTSSPGRGGRRSPARAWSSSFPSRRRRETGHAPLDQRRAASSYSGRLSSVKRCRSPG